MAHLTVLIVGTPDTARSQHTTVQVVRLDGTAVACAACAPVHDLAAFSYGDDSTGVAVCCGSSLTLLAPVAAATGP